MHFMLDSSEKGGIFVFICTSDYICTLGDDLLFIYFNFQDIHYQKKKKNLGILFTPLLQFLT